MSTYLVTGAAGFIASKVCEMLLAEGHTVVGIDNLNDYYDVRLKDYRLSKLLGVSFQPSADPKMSIYAGVGRVLRNASEGGVPKVAGPQVGRVIPNAPGSEKQSGGLGINRPTFEFHHLDIENLPALDALFSAHKFEAVFNLAARAGVRASLENPELYRRTNVLGEENVLQCQVKHGVRKHVLASSSSVYAGCPMPFTEDAALGRMQSPYAGTKHQAELLALDYHEKHGIDVSALRYFTVFGPAGRPDMAPFRFIKWIDEGTPITLYGDGTQARDFTYIDDIARGTILAAKSLGYEVINLGGGNNPVTLHTMIGWIEKALSGGPVSRRAVIAAHPASPADMKETWADIAKARRLLGWSPGVSPEQGFKMAVDWHTTNRAWIKGIKP